MLPARQCPGRLTGRTAATYSPGLGTITGRRTGSARSPYRAGLGRAADQQDPVDRTPCAPRASRASARPPSMPSTAARATFAGDAFGRVSPARTGGVAEVGSAFPVQVGQQRQPAGAGRGRERQRVELGQRPAQQSRPRPARGPR